MKKWENIAQKIPDKQKQIKAKTEYAKKQGDAYSPVLNSQVNKWGQSKSTLENMTGDQIRLKGNRPAGGVIQEDIVSNDILTKDQFHSMRKDLSTDKAKEKLAQLGEHINGAVQFEASTNTIKGNCCKITTLRKMVKKEGGGSDIPTEKKIVEYVNKRVNDALKKINPDFEGDNDTTTLLANLHGEVEGIERHNEKQPGHSDIPTSGKQEWTTYQGSILLTPGPSTICYKMDNVKWYPTHKDVAQELKEQYPTPISMDEIKTCLAIKPLKALLNDWARLVFTCKKRIPETTIRKPGHMTLMMGNHPHMGPGHDKFRLSIFFTGRAKTKSNSKSKSKLPAYDGGQMSKEKLLLFMIREIITHFGTTGEQWNDHVHIITYFYMCFANAVQETIMQGSYDGTYQNKNDGGQYDFKAKAF